MVVSAGSVVEVVVARMAGFGVVIVTVAVVVVLASRSSGGSLEPQWPQCWQKHQSQVVGVPATSVGGGEELVLAASVTGNRKT